MALIQWSEKYAVNIEEIDTQHQKLVAILNDLLDAMGRGQGKTVLDKTFNELEAYTKTHFFAEEKLMIVYGYSDYNRHRSEHGKLINDLKNYKKDFETGKSKLTLEILDFLKNWLINHITLTDKELGKYLTSKGLT